MIISNQSAVQKLLIGWILLILTIDGLLGGFHLELKLSKDMFQVLQLARVA